MSQLVSVIIPCYNAGKYIERALDSVCRQTYQNIEVICVNDGSTDNTLSILKKYKQEHGTGIRVFSIKNAGVSAARNIGLKNSYGEYILFLDADDIYADEYVENLVKALEKNNVDIAYAYWTNDIEKLGKGEKEEKRYTLYEIVSHFMYRPTPVSFFNYIYKRGIIKQYNIKFDETLRYGEDNLFFWKYICHIQFGIYIDCPLYWYYQNEDSAMHNPSWKIVDGIEAVKKVSLYLRDNNFQYIEEFENYMPARTIFSIEKEFARYGKKEFFLKFYKSYRVKEEMQKLINKNGIVLSCAGQILKKFPRCFYYIVKVAYIRKD